MSWSCSFPYPKELKIDNIKFIHPQVLFNEAGWNIFLDLFSNPIQDGFFRTIDETWHNYTLPKEDPKIT